MKIADDIRPALRHPGTRFLPGFDTFEGAWLSHSNTAVTMAVHRFPLACNRDNVLAPLAEKVTKSVQM
jgi:hypothetical protein